jgi:hypothetical protein
MKYAILKPRNESVEQFQDSYMKNNVLPLWPPVWIKHEDIKKQLDKRKRNLLKLQNNPTKPSTSTNTSTASSVNKNAGVKHKPDSTDSKSTKKSEPVSNKNDLQPATIVATTISSGNSGKEQLQNGVVSTTEKDAQHTKKTDKNDIRVKIPTLGTDLTIIPIANENPAKLNSEDAKQHKPKKDNQSVSSALLYLVKKATTNCFFIIF